RWCCERTERRSVQRCGLRHMGISAPDLRAAGVSCSRRRAAHLSCLRPGRGISRIPIRPPPPNGRRGNAARGGPRSRPPTVDRRQATRAWELSTNLTQISDWLTKIIVGVSLVEAKSFWNEIQILSAGAADWLFEMRHGSPVLIPAVMVAGAVFGFLFAYLYPELIIALLNAGAS